MRRLEGYSVKRIIVPVEAYAFLGDLLGMRYWLTNPIFYENCKPVIEKAYSLLADDISRNLYRSILEFRLTGDYKILPAPDLIHQYFPQDIPSWTAPLRLVDCGAFDGDTLAGFASSNIEIEGVAAFEPDLVNFMKLSQYISSLKNKISEALLFPCGVYASTQQMTFEIASGISNKGDAVVQCMALDDVIPTFAPNLIKMDIEGAEYDALLGARRNQHARWLYLFIIVLSIFGSFLFLWKVLRQENINFICGLTP